MSDTTPVMSDSAAGGPAVSEHSGTGAEAAADARRELGMMLADLRQRAGFSQRELGRLTRYDHTVIAHAEKGRPAAAEAFWRIADSALGAEGTLAARYDRVRHLESALREKARQEKQAARQEHAAHWHTQPAAPPAPAEYSGSRYVILVLPRGPQQIVITIEGSPATGQPDDMTSYDSDDDHPLRQLTMARLERTRRDLRASAGLMTKDSPAHAPIRAHLQAIDAELTGRARNPETSGEQRNDS